MAPPRQSRDDDERDPSRPAQLSDDELKELREIMRLRWAFGLGGRVTFYTVGFLGSMYVFRDFITKTISAIQVVFKP